MNVINVGIDFKRGICEKQGISVVTGDYNSTKVVFEFNEGASGTKMFEMKNPSGELAFVDEIVNNEIILVGEADVTDDNGYIKYKDTSDNIYWYDKKNNKIYDSSYNETSGISLDTLEKQTKTASLFTEEGDYTFEVSLYGEDSKLTSVCDYITANKEEVVIDDETIELYLPTFDNLINTITTKIDQADIKLGQIDVAINEANTLNIDVNKVNKTATIDLTKKDGTHKQVQIRDGYDLEYNWNGTELGVKREDEQNYDYVDLKGERGDCYFATFSIVEGHLIMNKPEELSQINFRLNPSNGHLEVEVGI